ncbi:MAG: [Fe-S]-binding protein [Bacteroidetes bacterium HGW-Bacteroidetes-1]|jgi:L-lactate dehydrogenase complex protein LldF|nr:MAG: [Fe-S]-binding protein [Bacteroidetes bacterium HGW-Bacteroidetes-1]
MTDNNSNFLKMSEKVAFDKDHRRKINFNISRYDQAVDKGKKRFVNLELSRQRAYSVKHKVLSHLDKYLVEFETNFQRNGGKVIWAVNGQDAVKEILKLLEKEKIEKVVKSKSMTTEEIDLNEALEKKKIKVFETDLGEFIVQTAGEKPYHIVTPAMHKSKEDVAALYHDKFGLPDGSTPEEITLFTRKLLREEYRQSGAGITGANFLIADTGSVAVTENEGNALLSMAFPKLHIVIAGIEKILPSVDDLDLFWPLLATHGTGQTMTVYNSLLSGPSSDESGPSQMVVVLLDNGRTNLLAKTRQRSALGCIRCGACLNVCPVYKNIGGYTYDTTYSGPIGAVITPHLKNMEDYQHLSFASTICGACTEVCPVKIPLHEMLLINRNEAVTEKLVSSSDRSIIKKSTFVLNSRKLLDMTSGGTKNIVLKYFVGKAWGSRRKLPMLADKSFSQLWSELEEQKKKE